MNRPAIRDSSSGRRWLRRFAILGGLLSTVLFLFPRTEDSYVWVPLPNKDLDNPFFEGVVEGKDVSFLQVTWKLRLGFTETPWLVVIDDEVRVDYSINWDSRSWLYLATGFICLGLMIFCKGARETSEP